jgi:TonB family protein
MRVAATSAISIGIHAALCAAVLLGSAKTGRSDAPRTLALQIAFPAPQSGNADHDAGGPSVPGPIAIDAPEIGSISIASLPQTGATGQSLVSPAGSSASGMQDPGHAPGWTPWRNEESAEILTAPLPIYPELLRQAGIAGKVVLEAVVDSTGQVLAQSITLVSATHPGFVEPARQALMQTLFRPAMADGKPVRLRVRIPYDFTIRNGIGRAR